MRTYGFLTVDVFTDRRFGGNPLAVFPDASGLSDGEMQSLAAEFNLSETTFVVPPEDPSNTARVRIFNRTSEMPFAGHPIAAPQPRSLGTEMPVELLAGCVGLDVSDVVVAAHRPIAASVGNSFVIAEVKAAALSRAAPDISRFRSAVEAFPTLGPR